MSKVLHFYFKMNKCCFIGNLGKDVETKKVNDKLVADISIAVKDPYNKDKSDWVNVTFWGKKAEVLEKYCSKGSKIAVVGQFKNQVWEKDGEKKYKTYILGDELHLLGTSNKTQETNEYGFEGTIIDDEDVPF